MPSRPISCPISHPIRRRVAMIGAVAMLVPIASCTDRRDDPDSGRIVLTPPSDGGHTHAPGQADALPIGDGSSASAGGFRMVDVRLTRPANRTGVVEFTIVDRTGDPVTAYVEEQTKLLHLYVVRADLADFRHVHPTLGADGGWSAPIDLAGPGRYRVIAEFVPEASDGRPVVLGTARTLPGAWTPSVPPVGEAAESGDDGAIRVRLDGDARLGDDGRLRVVVSDLDGDPIQLGSYLGTYAHLTGFEIGGTGFAHAHPYGAPEQTDDGTVLTFHTGFAAAGDYRFFVQTRVDGFVHTVPITVPVTA